MARAFGWFLYMLMESQPVQCCDCPLDGNCNCACEMKYHEDLNNLRFHDWDKE